VGSSWSGLWISEQLVLECKEGGLLLRRLRVERRAGRQAAEACLSAMPVGWLRWSCGCWAGGFSGGWIRRRRFLSGSRCRESTDNGGGRDPHRRGSLKRLVVVAELPLMV